MGRDDELATLDAAYDRAGGGLVVVAGPAGIGKSALVSTACRRFAERGALVLTGGCPWGGGVAYAPLLTAWPPGESFADLLTELAGLGELPAGVAHAWLCDRVLASLARWSRCGPVVLVVEDAHWLDPASAALVELVARASAVLLVMTVRTDADPPPARLAELAAAPGATHLDLGPLPDAAIAELVTAVCPDLVAAVSPEPVPAVSPERAAAASPEPVAAVSLERVEAVVRRAEGHPLFARELARAPDGGLPASLRLLLAGRLRELGPAGRRVVAATALAGTGVTEATLVAVCGPDAARATRTAVGRGLLDRADGVLRCRHGLIAEAAAAELLPAETRRLHAALAHALPDAPPSVLARHWEHAGDPPRAARAWLAAAAEATRRYAHRAAADAYLHTLTLTPTNQPPVAPTPAGRDAGPLAPTNRDVGALARTDRPGAAGIPADRDGGALDGVDRTGVVHAAAEALWLAGDTAEAVRLVRGTLPAVTAGWRCVLLDRLREYLYASGQAAAAFDALAEARALAPAVADPALAARLDTAEGIRLMLAGAYAAGAAVAGQATGAADPLVRVRALGTRGVCLALDGDLDAGVRLLGQARDLAVETGTVRGLAHAANNLAFVLANASRYDEAARVCRETLDRLAAHGVAGPLGADLRVNLGVSLVALGRWDEATALSDPPPPGPATTPAKADAILLLSRAEIAARRGQPEDAEALLGRAAGLGGDNPVLAVETAYTAAVVARSAGRYRHAVTTCREALDRTGTGPADRLRLAALGLGALADLELAGGRVRRLDDPVKASTGLVEIAADALAGWPDPPPEAAALAAQCRAEASRLTRPEPERWAEVTSRFDGLRMPWYAAYARLRWADALVTVRSAAPVPDLLADAHRTARALGARPLCREVERVARRGRVPLVDAAEAHRPVADTLTDREREVLTQLAFGRTNAEIARLLVISVRTAGVHVSNILAKLGATNRAEAARIARDLLEC